MYQICRVRHFSTIITACVSVLVSSTGYTEEGMQLGRYLTVEPVAEIKAQFPLVEVGDITIPVGVSDGASAIAYVLTGSGYSVAPSEYLDPRSHSMLSSPVATTQRTMQKVTRLNAMAALAGPGFEVVVDPLSRRVAFDVCLHKPAEIRERMEAK